MELTLDQAILLQVSLLFWFRHHSF